MKQVVCIVDNHIYLQYGKVYNVVSEMDTDYKLERTDDGLMDIHVYRGDKRFFLTLEEFRNQKIEQILL
jgi:hypothetical protein